VIATDPTGPSTAPGLTPPMTFSPDGHYLITTSNCRACTTIDVLDISRGHITRRRTGEVGTGGVNAVAFSNNSHTFATSNGDGRGELWHPDTSELQHTDLSTLGGTALSFSADGSLLATGDCAGIRVWDLATTTLLGTFPQPGICPNVISFTKDDQSVSTTGLIATADTQYQPPFVATNTRWDLQIAPWQHNACAIANRNLTAAEWTQYQPGIPYHKTCPDLP